MTSIDTNVLVRLLVRDEHTARAEALFASGPIFIADTVLLEVDWVLRVHYDFPKAVVIDALRQVLRLANVVTPTPSRVLQALDWAEAGMDFADALHLAASPHRFASFDRKLARVAARLGAPEIRAP